jgi:putative oxygen-independent coproporphyrinogen III oxidase
LQKCPYCDFATRPISRADVPHRDYADALLRELAMRAPALRDASLVSVFFGGGTPSLWDAKELERVRNAILQSFAHVTDDVEVTVECNPSSLNREKAKALVGIGVNRVSIGVQSLNDARLRYLGRLHDADGALCAVSEAMEEVPRVSADLMFGMPEQSGSDFAAEVTRLLSLGLRHVSAYSLTIEPNTQFGALAKKGRLPLAIEDDVAECFAQGRSAFAEQGLLPYEVSNYAVPGEEARHNQHYWRGGAYLGLGAGAVGCLPTDGASARRYRNNADPAHYMQNASRNEVEDFEECLSPEDRVREALMLGLRTREGMHLDHVRSELKIDPLIERQKALQKRLATGDVVLEDGFLRVPSERWLTLDSIVRDLF